MFTIIRNLLILAARDMFAGKRLAVSISVAFGIQLGLAGFAPTFSMFVLAVVSGLIASFLFSFVKVTHNTAQTVKAARTLLVTV